MRLFGSIFLHTYENQFVVRFKGLHGYEITIDLLDNELRLTENNKQKSFLINPGSVILITVDQGSPGNRDGSPNTVAELYLKDGEMLSLVYAFKNQEAVNDFRKTKTYLLVEYFAQTISDKYGIPWEYKYEIETPEKEQTRKKGVAAIFIMFVITTLMLIWLFRHE